MKIVDDFGKARILVLGDVMLDRYWWGSVSRISPEAPVPVVRLKNTTVAAGGAANVAANIAGLGAQAMLIGVVGSDDEARLLSDVLSVRGVSAESLVCVDGRPTTVKTRIIAHSQQVARIDSEHDHDLTDSDADAVIEKIKTAMPSCDVMVVSDYAKGLLSSAVLIEAIRLAKDAGTKILVDPKGKDYGKYAGATLLTPNKREAAEACNLEEDGQDLVDQAGTSLMSGLDIGALLITQGEEGMTLFERKCDPRHFEAMARKVYDVTGAGDTVIATLATAIGAGADIADATELANIAAGIAVERVGTATITSDDLKEALADR